MWLTKKNVECCWLHYLDNFGIVFDIIWYTLFLRLIIVSLHEVARIIVLARWYEMYIFWDEFVMLCKGEFGAVDFF